MYELIAAIVHSERDATAQDFAQFIGCHNWLLIKLSDNFPIIDGNDDDFEGIYELTIRSVDIDNNTVTIAVSVRGMPGVFRMTFDANELAKRIEES